MPWSAQKSSAQTEQRDEHASQPQWSWRQITRLVGGRPQRVEGRRTPMRGLELPLGALHQDGRLDELQRMHDGLHLAPPDLFGPAPLGERRDGTDGLRVALLLEDRLEVPVQAA